MPRFLVIQLADLGDVVLTTPALAALRRAHPAAHIALLTTPHGASVVAGTGLVDATITIERALIDSPRTLLSGAHRARFIAFVRRLRAGRFDTAVLCHHLTTHAGTLKYRLLLALSGASRRIGLDNGRGAFLTDRVHDAGFGTRHQADYWLALVALAGADSTPRSPIVATDPRILDSAVWQTWRSAAPAAPCIAIHAGSGGFNPARRWLPDRFAALADALIEQRGARVVLVGAPDDSSAAVRAAMQGDALDLGGQTSVPELAAVLSQCDLFIGADSGVMHIAAAAQTPVVALFGPTNADAWRPYTPAGRHVVVSTAPECAPCAYVGDELGLSRGGFGTCMRTLDTAPVLAAALRLLAGAPGDDGDNGDDGEAGTHVYGKHRAPVPRLSMLGVPVDAITYAAWLDLIDGWTRARRRTAGGAWRAQHVCTVNPEFLMIAQDDPLFRLILRRAALCVPDGVGLLWAARRRGTPLPERVTGSDGVPIIAARAAQRGWRLFFLGAAEGVASRAADVLRQRHPDVQIVGIVSGSPRVEDEDALVAQINAADADILFVAYGAPVQDKWIARNLHRLNVAMAMGVGGAFDFIAGVVPRAPAWVQRLGLEWLFRLWLQPWRLRRQLRLPRFVWATLRDSPLDPRS